MQTVLTPAEERATDLEMQIVRAPPSLEVNSSVDAGGWRRIELVRGNYACRRFADRAGHSVGIEIAEGVAQVNFLRREIDQHFWR